MPAVALAAGGSASGSSHPSAGPGVPFYMYTADALDHRWLSNCSGFHHAIAGVRLQNTAEVGAARILRRHPLRVRNPDHAMLFFVPVYTYVSKWVSPGCGNTTHRERMAAAATALRASPQWRRFQGRDHFFVSTTWSTSRTSYRAQMYELANVFNCAVAGRYKQICKHACARRSSSLASCTVHAPYPTNPHAAVHYRPKGHRPLLVSFSGSLDVCCSGTAIRCRLGDYIMASINNTDVVIRPSLPANASVRAGVCTERTLSTLGSRLLLTSQRPGVDKEPSADVARSLALDFLALRSTQASQLVVDRRSGLKVPRRLAESWREAAVGEEAVLADARLMASSVFCFTPAGDTCVQGRFYSAVAAGCIPVVACKGAAHPVAFEHLVHYDQFWISVSTGEWDNPHALLSRLRGMDSTEVRRYQLALERHRTDVLYDVPHSRVGGNLLGELMRTCYSKEALADYEKHRMCNVSADWPPWSKKDTAHNNASGMHWDGTAPSPGGKPPPDEADSDESS